MRMHASMFAADPPLSYWKPASLLAMEAVRSLRAGGVGCWFTMDAGPNVKVLTLPQDAEIVRAVLSAVAQRVDVLTPGGPARVE